MELRRFPDFGRAATIDLAVPLLACSALSLLAPRTAMAHPANVFFVPPPMCCFAAEPGVTPGFEVERGDIEHQRGYRLEHRERLRLIVNCTPMLLGGAMTEKQVRLCQSRCLDRRTSVGAGSYASAPINASYRWSSQVNSRGTELGAFFCHAPPRLAWRLISLVSAGVLAGSFLSFLRRRLS